MRQGVRLEPLLQGISDFLDDQGHIVEQVRRDLALVFRKDKALSRAALAFIDIAVKHKSTQELVPAPSR